MMTPLFIGGIGMEGMNEMKQEIETEPEKKA